LPRRVTPKALKDHDYQELFERMSGILLNAATVFCSDQTPDEKRDIISRFEDDGDEIVQIIKDKLDTFGDPPFRDKAHVYRLINNIDNVLDELKKAASRIVLYKLMYIPEFLKMGNIIWQEAGVIRECVHLMSNPGRNRRKIRDKCIEISRLESLGDDLTDECVAVLLERVERATLSAMEFMLIKEVIERLEHGINQCEDVGDFIDEVKKKNS
jgi:uncharacterized protein